MNNDLYLWDAALALPASFDEACHSLERLESQQSGPNQKFSDFAQALKSRSTGGVAAWASRLPEQASQWRSAVWPLSLPADDLVQTLVAVVEHAGAHGLVVLADPLGIVFTPGGGILPPEMRDQWSELTAQLEAKPPLSKVEVSQLTATLMRDRLAPHGFQPRKMDDSWSAEFVRPTRDGFQTVQMRVVGNSPFLKCVVRCGHRSVEVEAIFEEIFGPAIRIPETFWFNPSAFVGSRMGELPIENTGEIRAMLDVLERYGLPPLDLAAEPGGLDRLMNEPQRFPFEYPGLNPRAPQNLLAEYTNFGRNLCLKPLIVAWLARNPAFEARVAELRQFVQTRADVSDADVQRVVEHLRAMPA